MIDVGVHSGGVGGAIVFFQEDGRLADLIAIPVHVKNINRHAPA